MAAHENITDRNAHTIDLSSYASTARGIDGPKGAILCTIYAPASSACYVQTGAVTDGSTDISTDGLTLPAGVQTAFPCSVDDAGGGVANRPSIYVQGDANVTVRFTGGGVG